MTDKDKIKTIQYSSAVIGAIGGFAISKKISGCIICDLMFGIVGGVLGYSLGFELGKTVVKSTKTDEKSVVKEPVIGGLASGVATTSIV